MSDVPVSWFDQEVAAYERARPSYPDAAFEALVAYLSESQITPPFEAVEIGPGPGKATEPLLRYYSNMAFASPR